MKYEIMKFDNCKIHTSGLKNILNSICGKIVDNLAFVDGNRISCLKIRYKLNDTYYGSENCYIMLESSCHSKHRRYLELLENFGKTNLAKQYNINYDSLAELQLKMTIFGYG